MIVLIGFLIGWFFGIKGAIIASLLFIAFVIYDTETKQKRFDEAMKRDEEWWKERVKQGLPGMKL